MADVNVNTDVLTAMARELELSARNLRNATDAMSGFVSAAGSSLAGAQYRLAVETTNRMRNEALAAEQNLNSLKKHMEQLNEYATEYLRCRFGG